MIFVTTGSQKFPFDRLLQAVDDLVARGIIRQSVLAQSGCSTYRPEHYCTRAFLEHGAYEAALAGSTAVITHGGTATIIKALLLGKRVIAVPRLARFGEHVDDHQIQLVEAFAEAQYLEPCFDTSRLGQAYDTCLASSYRPFVSHNEAFLADLDARLSSAPLSGK